MPFTLDRILYDLVKDFLNHNMTDANETMLDVQSLQRSSLAIGACMLCLCYNIAERSLQSRSTAMNTEPIIMHHDHVLVLFP